MSNVWFTADEHYGHENIIKYQSRKVKDINEMKELLIGNNNKVVRKGDLVYHLGDMFWQSMELGAALNIMARLNGQHYYIYGNHDKIMRRYQELRDKFIWCKDYAKIEPVKGQPKIILMHYAMRVWDGSHKGHWQLYGHSHGNLKPSVKGQTNEESPYSMDVGVDTNNMFPYSFEDVAKRMKEIKEKYGN